MMNDEIALSRVLAHYPSLGRSPLAGEPTLDSLGGAGGFSGAEFWRLTTKDAAWCLRRWPRPHPSGERLAFIHAVLDHVWREGVLLVPLPVCSSEGKTFLEQDGHLWELTPWLPGRADYHDAPSPIRLAAAFRALAELHRAAATFPDVQPTVQQSEGLQQRRATLQRLLHGEAEQIAAEVREADWPELATRARRVISLFGLAATSVERELAAASQLLLPHQPAIRDIWHDHVLFENDRVSGIVDFGAMRIESIAGEVSRLMGSLAGDDPQNRRIALAAYETIRPLSAEEHVALRAFDRSTTLLAGMNWLRWIYLEGRTFDDRRRIEARLDEILPRLEHDVIHASG